MKNKFFVLLIFIFCFSFIIVSARNASYKGEGDKVIIQNNEFGKFDLGCPFNGRCKNIVVNGNFNSEDLRLLCICSRECETLDLTNVRVTDETEIPNWCFIDVYNLKKVILPPGLKNIGNHTFCNCICLENICLPDGLKKIGDGSFQNCPKLQAKISSTVKIGKNVFSGCPHVDITSNQSDLNLPRKNYSIFTSILNWVGLL